jgi:transglutaminase-like putative cysteine protease
MSFPVRRAVRFTFEVEVPAGERPAMLWIPRPADEPWQRTLGEAFPPSELDYGEDPHTGNQMVRLRVPPRAAPVRFCTRFSVERLRRDRARGAPTAWQPQWERYLLPDRKVPTEGPVVEQARAWGAAGTPLAKAEAAYRHVLEQYGYDARGCTPERFDQLGNLEVACDLRTGTCTELHGIYVALLRAMGLPARFRFGFNLPRDREEGTIGGYHCWSEVWLAQLGWLAVDVSEALKRPEYADFYFGSLDPHRVAFTSDRDVDLSPQQADPPLDKFIFPYAEVDGAPLPLGLSFHVAPL